MAYADYNLSMIESSGGFVTDNTTIVAGQPVATIINDTYFELCLGLLCTVQDIPDITLLYPAAELNTLNTSLSFVYNVTSEILDSCQIYFNGILMETNSSPNTPGNNTFYYNLLGFSTAIIPWSILCNDTQGNFADTPTRYLYYNYTPGVTAPTGPFGGGVYYLPPEPFVEILENESITILVGMPYNSTIKGRPFQTLFYDLMVAVEKDRYKRDENVVAEVTLINKRDYSDFEGYITTYLLSPSNKTYKQKTIKIDKIPTTCYDSSYDWYLDECKNGNDAMKTILFREVAIPDTEIGDWHFVATFHSNRQQEIKSSDSFFAPITSYLLLILIPVILIAFYIGRRSAKKKAKNKKTKKVKGKWQLPKLGSILGAPKEKE